MSNPTFTGIKNGRPTFSFEGEVAPAWLKKLAARITINGDKAMLDGKELEIGQEVSPS